MDLSMYPTTVAAVSIESCSSATIETESPLREFIEPTSLFTSPRRQPHAGTRRPINGDSLYVSHAEHVWNHSSHVSIRRLLRLSRAKGERDTHDAGSV